MNGTEFYDFLRNNYNLNGQPLYGNFTFRDWLFKHSDGTSSFQFNIPGNNPKSIRRDIIIAAWDANRNIDDNWLELNFNEPFHNDCRLHVLNFLIESNSNLR